VIERPRALQAMRAGAPVTTAEAIEEARALIAAASRPVALVSSGASNEELAAFKAALGDRFVAFVKPDRAPAPGEVVQDDFLIRADKNPNTAGARALFPLADDPGAPLQASTDLVLVWGEGFDMSRRPPGARLVVLDCWTQPGHAAADVFIPLSLHTERRGTFTNFQGVVSAFEACFPKPASVEHAAEVFGKLAAPAQAGAQSTRAAA
jgi:NADH-quinone oxidoreductase subunit G